MVRWTMFPFKESGEVKSLEKTIVTIYYTVVAMCQTLGNIKGLRVQYSKVER